MDEQTYKRTEGGEAGMSRLIDADALNAAMYHEAFETDTDMQKWDSGCWIRYKMFERALKAAPTIEAAPVVHGHWVDKGIVAIEFIRERHEYECSRCGKAVHLLENEKPYYCDNCGCKMDEVTT